MVVGSGLAIAAVALLVHSLVWSAIVPHARPHLPTTAALAATSRLSQTNLSAAVRTSKTRGVPGRPTPERGRGAPLAPYAPDSLRVAALPHHAGHSEQAAPPSIVLLSMLPRTVLTGDAATLCISADHAQNLFVTGLGAVNPKLTTCRSVRPNKTTTFVASATNELGQQTTRTISVEVRRP